jgi:hypothetical protein
MILETPPEPKLEPQSQPWGRWVSSSISALSRGVSGLIASVTRLTSDTAANFNRQQTQIATLNSLANTLSAEFTYGITGFTGWYSSSPASFFIESPTNRMEIGFGGSLNGGSGYFAYSVTVVPAGTVVVDRATILANPAQRVAVSGGASFAPSGWKTVVIDVPAGTTLQVSLELNTDSEFTYFFGGSILARPLPSSVQLPTI